jgi:hypothetical protein
MNLLPLQEKEILVKDFSRRFLTLYIYAASSVVLLLCFVVFPKYLFEKSKNNVKPANAYKNSPGMEDKDFILSIPKDLGDKTSFLISGKYNSSILSNIKTIVDLKPTQISIKGISYRILDKDGKKVIEIILSGVSLNRDSLTDFVKKIKESNNFSSASVPVSDFTKEKDLEFNMTINKDI